jgi:anionic cell wall polymer biosynthesis LytR-Cps2A-Psr (LCP) family protein
MKQNRKVSGTLVILIIVFIAILTAFFSMAYFKVNPAVKLSNQEVRIDSFTLLKQKDSIIDVLNQDNVRLKKMFDEKHDTVWVPKPVYLKPKSDTLN